MSKLTIQLVTPERTVLSEEVVSLSCPTTDGRITILPGHTPLIASLVSGELIARNSGNNDEHFIHVAGGFVEIKPNNEIIILADAAEHFYEINVQQAEEAKMQAEKTLQEQMLSNEEYALAASVLQKKFKPYCHCP